MSTREKARRKLLLNLNKPETEEKVAKRKAYRKRLNQIDWYPLRSPGMPFPGSDFLAKAAALGDPTELQGKGKTLRLGAISPTLENLYRKALRRVGFNLTIEITKTRRESVNFLPGHLWGGRVDGPERAKVMVVGKHPGDEEMQESRNFVGKSAKLFREKLEYFNIHDYESWYVTNLIKFNPPEGTKVRASWVRECLPLLHQELRLVRPKILVLLGSDAAKAVLGDKVTVSSMMGRLVEYEIPLSLPDEELGSHRCFVMVITHPAAVLHQPESEIDLDQGIARLGLLLSGTRFDQAETDIDHRVIDSIDQLEDTLSEAEAECKNGVIAVDAEWEGEHPQNKGAYLRTIQISWKEKKAACFVVRRQGGGAVSKTWEKQLRSRLQKFFKGKRVWGQFFNSDLEWLVHWGLDLREQYGVPLLEAEDGTLPWDRTANEGGGDVGIAFHAIHETASLKLEHLGLRYTPVPRYDVALNEWKKKRAKELDIKEKDLEGYGDCPDDVLYPYANYDADQTFRLIPIAQKLLDKDYYQNSCREAYWRNMKGIPAALEMHQTGLQWDKARSEELTTTFMWARERLQKRICKWAKWPDFNIRSVQHVRELLFGERLNGRDWIDGAPKRIRPEGAKSMKLRPLFDTSKRPVLWSEVERQHKEREASPSTNKLALAMLAQDNPQHEKHVTWLRDYRFVDQVLKSALRPPDFDEDAGGFLTDDSGEYTYSGGIPSVVCSDGRVRTHFYTTKETGRWSSSRPPLQNLSSTRDKDYERILGAENYTHKLRSMFRSTLKGMPGAWCDEDTVLVEADYIGAELCGMAWMSGDRQMMDHARRNCLPEDHKDYYDIHSNVAVLAFRLNCAPTKDGLDKAGKKHLRNVAKGVVFGAAYGRGAKAIALAAREQGVFITEHDAQQVLDTLFELYPGLMSFFEDCRNRVTEERWMASCFRRFRRFPRTDERSTLGEFERQAMNFPIQSMIADAVNDALGNLRRYRELMDDPDLFRFVLQIHDAIVLEVPVSKIETVVDFVLPESMTTLVPIYPTDLSGKPTKKGPYRLGIDVKIAEHWGEKLKWARGQELGVPKRFCAV